MVCRISYLFLTNPKTVQTVMTGRRGRPRKEFQPDILQAALNERRGPTHLSDIFHCHPRTIRRRALDYGISEPCPPVYTTFHDPETGHTMRLYRSSTAPVSVLSNDELDAILSHILTVFPDFGRRMIHGHLVHLGHHVPRQRIRESYERVSGSPAGLRAQQIGRRQYSVPGPNSLWHHDGQHGVLQPIYP